MTKPILLFKAAIAGGAAADLFSGPVTVGGYVSRGGHYVAPYQARRAKRTASAPHPAPPPPAVVPDLFARSAAPPPAKVQVHPDLEAAVPGLTAAVSEIMPRVAPGANVTFLETPPGFPSTGFCAWDAQGDIDISVTTKDRNRTAILKTVLHEIGHTVMISQLAAAPPAVRAAVVEQWRQDVRRDTLISSVWGGIKSQPELTTDYAEQLVEWVQGNGWWDEDHAKYLGQFAEWQAERAARWMATDREPRTVLEQYFARAARLLREALQTAMAMLGFRPHEGALEQLLRETWARPAPSDTTEHQRDWWKRDLPAYRDHSGQEVFDQAAEQKAAPPLPSSAGITTKADAEAYWQDHFRGKVATINVATKKGVRRINVEFPPNNTHMWTREAKPGETPDAYDRPARHEGPRTFERERAVLMDRMFRTIEAPWRVIVGDKSRHLYLSSPPLPGGGSYVVVLEPLPSGGNRFVSAHARSKVWVDRTRAPGHRAATPHGPLQKSETPPRDGVPNPVLDGVAGPSGPTPLSGSPVASASAWEDRPGVALQTIARVFSLLKSIPSSDRWITIHAHGIDGKGQPILIRDMPDGSAKVVGGAGGALNHLRLRGVRSGADYASAAREKAEAHRDKRKRQREQDRKEGLLDSKAKAKEAVRAAVKEHEAKFVQQVAKTLGWKDEDVRFPAEKYQNLTPSAQKKAAADHARAIFAAARDAVEHQRKQLVGDAEMRGAAGIGEVPLQGAAPESLSVQDLAPIPSTAAGLGFVPAYEKRAAEKGLTPEARAEEAAAFKPPTNPPKPGQGTAEEKRRALSEKITEELQTVQEPSPRLDPHVQVDARAAVDLLKAEKLLKAARASAATQNAKIDAAKAPVEPQAFPVEVKGTMPDREVLKDLESDLKTVRTRAFLDEVGRMPGGEGSIGRHVGVGAYNSLNSVALAAGGASLIDRSVVDVLGVAGAAQVLARRLGADLGEEEMGTLRAAMGRYHVDHYMAHSEQALRDARDWHEMAHEIEVDPAAAGADLVVAQELNAKRREFTGNAERVLGTALGEMEANAALVLALEKPHRAQVQVSMGKTGIPTAITRLRALGLQSGDYQLEQVGASTMLTLHGPGLDRLAQPVAREDMERVRTALDIINGHQDEDDWLPGGVARRPEAAMTAPAGVAPRLAQPFRVGPSGVDRAVEDYIGGRMADGDSPADIMAGLLSEDTMGKAGDRGAFMAAIDHICPLYDGEGKLVRAEAYTDGFEKLAEAYTQRAHGDVLQPIHRQKFDVDQVAVDALHHALAKHPDGVAAFKPVGDLSPQDQAALRNVFAREYGRTDPAADGMRAELEKLNSAEPAAEVDDMFGRGPNPAHADWRAKRDEMAGKLDAASMSWGKYLDVMGSPANAYAAMQDVVRSHVLASFAEVHNRAKPKAALKLGRTVIAHDLNHLDALDPAAREKRLEAHRGLVDRLRNRVGGKYAAGAVSDKLDAEREHEEAFNQAQMGLFGTSTPGDGADEDDAASERKPLALGERHTIGHAAERQIAGMMPIVGRAFRPGQPVHLWSPSMSGKYVARQRAVKLIEANKKVVLGMGMGSGKTSIMLSAFTNLHSKGKAKRGLFCVPSVVQGQFHGESLTLLEPGKFDWHCKPGASQEERIAGYKDPSKQFNVVTHSALRDDVLHLASKRDGSTPDAVVDKMKAMTPAERRDYVRGVLDAEGIDHDFLAVDEGHNLLSRQGKEDSRMAVVLDALSHGMKYGVLSSADPTKNDVSETFDLLYKMDPERYHDRAAFMRKYGVDTAAAKDGLKRELARHLYTASIDPGVAATKTQVPVELGKEEHATLKTLDNAVAAARVARMKGDVDVAALKTLSPSSFEGVDAAKHEEVAKQINQSIGIIHNTAVGQAVSGNAKTEAVARLVSERKGKQGVVFSRSLQRVKEIAERLKQDGHSVVTLTGGDTTAEKDRKKREFQEGKHSVIVLSDAGAVGANLQKGKYLIQHDVSQTAMTHSQRNGRIFRQGQQDDVELLDLVANHPSEVRARKRLAAKYELRAITTSPMEGLDDQGIAAYLQRAKAGKLEQEASLHVAGPKPGSQGAPAVGGKGEKPLSPPVPPAPDEQASMF